MSKTNHNKPKPISRPALLVTLRITDLFAVFLTGYLTNIFYISDFNPTLLGFADIYLWVEMAAAVGTIFAFGLFEIYAIHDVRSTLKHGLHIISAWAIVFGVLATYFFLNKSGIEFSRVWFVSWFISGFAVIMGTRLIYRNFINRWLKKGRLERRAIVVGGGKAAEQLIEAINNSSEGEVKILGIFDDRFDDRSPDLVAGLPKLGEVKDLVKFAREADVDLLLISLPVSAETRLLQLLKKLWVLPVDIRISALQSKLRFRPRSYSYIGTVPVLDLFDRPLSDWDVIAKNIEDRIIAFFAIIMFSPIMAAVAIAVKLDSPGPVLFKQKRYGFNNELIEVYKFRSMRNDVEDKNASKLVTKGDPRVTKVGRFIRKTSMDELPQLFNVLTGQLSLVGPRPHAVQAKADNRLYGEVVDSYFARHKVKPGITGWAQINGWRGETDTENKIHQRVEHDLYYIEKWSVFFDLYILVMTPFALFSTKNAY
ncbi:MAG: undecaprenyl-phosphate glucose phosphotransferase [Rhizobiales bacterium]|nr:undecaprenyl-phosphate glucose phosphotransferase [Hyphomicrobiales bacterium]NRB14756.1 undecaprenyl-phosphate glucose phosphotransferase [Hyphomicrobiales bacterium]